MKFGTKAIHAGQDAGGGGAVLRGVGGGHPGACFCGFTQRPLVASHRASLWLHIEPSLDSRRARCVGCGAGRFVEASNCDDIMAQMAQMHLRNQTNW